MPSVYGHQDFQLLLQYATNHNEIISYYGDIKSVSDLFHAHGLQLPMSVKTANSKSEMEKASGLHEAQASYMIGNPIDQLNTNIIHCLKKAKKKTVFFQVGPVTP
jgi:hypothetical protein